jgi:hypothetical protein
MHKETFDIIQDSNIDNFLMTTSMLTTIFEAGTTLIARVTAHSFAAVGIHMRIIDESYYRGSEQDPHRIIPGVLSYEATDKGELHILARQAHANRAYIMFQESAPIECDPPTDWFWEDTASIAFCWEPCDDPLECLQVINYAMSTLQKWADSLPTLTQPVADSE